MQHLVIIQGRSFTPVLRGGADKGDVIITRHAVLFPPVQLDHILTARLHQPVHQTQGHKPAEGHHASHHAVITWCGSARLSVKV